MVSAGEMYFSVGSLEINDKHIQLSRCRSTGYLLLTKKLKRAHRTTLEIRMHVIVLIFLLTDSDCCIKRQ